MQTANLVLTEWTVSNKALDSSGTMIRIAGRKAGVISWLLARVGIDPASRFVVTKTKIEFSSASFIKGRENRIIPLQNICSTFYGYQQPFLAAALAFFAVIWIGLSIVTMASGEQPLLRLVMSLMVPAVGVFVAWLIIKLNKKLTIAVVEVSGVVSGFSVKKSLIEGIDVVDENAKNVCELIESLLDARRGSGFVLAEQKQPPFTAGQSHQPPPNPASTGRPSYAAQEKGVQSNPRDHFDESQAHDDNLKQARLKPEVIPATGGATAIFKKVEGGAIHFVCGYCSQSLQIDVSAGGQEIKCPECGLKQVVPVS